MAFVVFSFLLPSSLAIDTQVYDKFSLLRFSMLEYRGYSNRIERWGEYFIFENSFGGAVILLSFRISVGIID